MPHLSFAIATKNEVEAVDLAEMVSSRWDASLTRVSHLADTDWPTGLTPGDLPMALFLGLTRDDPAYAWFRHWATSHAVNLVVINGAPADALGAQALQRPFTETDVALILDKLDLL